MNENMSLIFTFLMQEGYRPKKFSNTCITFKYEGNEYGVFFNDKLQDYIALNDHMLVDLYNEEIDLYKTVNKVNEKIFVKASLKTFSDNRKYLVLMIDFLGQPEFFAVNLQNFMRTIQEARKFFIEELVKTIP